MTCCYPVETAVHPEYLHINVASEDVDSATWNAKRWVCGPCNMDHPVITTHSIRGKSDSKVAIIVRLLSIINSEQLKKYH